MASKRVGCSLFLPTTENDSYIEKDSQKATDKERENERENIFRVRDIKFQRERESERESVRKRGRTGESVR